MQFLGFPPVLPESLGEVRPAYLPNCSQRPQGARPSSPHVTSDSDHQLQFVFRLLLSVMSRYSLSLPDPSMMELLLADSLPCLRARTHQYGMLDAKLATWAAEFLGQTQSYDGLDDCRNLKGVMEALVAREGGSIFQLLAGHPGSIRRLSTFRQIN